MPLDVRRLAKPTWPSLGHGRLRPRRRLQVGTAFEVVSASAHRTAFVTSLNRPSDVSWSLKDLAITLGLALLLTLLLAFVTELFNSTLEENYAEVRSWFGLKERKPSEPSRTRRGVVFATMLIVGGILCAFISPDAGLNLATVALVFGMSVALMMVTAGFGVPNSVVMRRRFADPGRVATLPSTIVIAAVCVLGSRLLNFQPGLLYGLLAGLTFRRELSDRMEGKLAAIACSAILGISVAAWFISEPMAAAAQSSSSFWLFTGEATIAAICFIGLETLAFALLPIRFMVGPTVMGWSKVGWFFLFVASFGMYIHILVRPGSGTSANRRRSRSRS